MEKKSFLFVVSDFDVGGITTSLRNLTDVLIKEGHFVGIMNLPGVEKLPEDYNQHIELVPLLGKAKLWNLNIEILASKSVLKRVPLLFVAAVKKLMNQYHAWDRFIFSDTYIDGYDVAVAFRQSPLCYKFVRENVNTSRRIGFWHGDPRYMNGIDRWIDCLDSVDYVACVSDAVSNHMREMFPQYGEKYKTVYNIFNSEEIIMKSGKFHAGYSTNTINLVTVARIDFEQKQLHFIPEVASRLRASSFDFCWTIVGDGPDFSKLKAMISEMELEDCVKCVGNQKNPFPFVAQADVFVNTSIGEAYGMVITEAMILGIPCIASSYDALPEIIKDGENGLIADNSIDGVETALKSILRDRNLLERIKQNVGSCQYTYMNTYKSFMEICN